ncbi:MAG: hypothetical protein ABJB40_02345 [Acidobacteriota bacterium]
MTNHVERRCEHSGCGETATKRVRFAYRINDHEVLSTVHELDLCDAHIAEVRKNFSAVMELDVEPGGGLENTSALKHSA